MERLFNGTYQLNFTSVVTTTALMYTEHPDQYKLPYDFPNILLICLGLFVASSSLLCNGSVLQSLLMVSSDDLKSKIFLINSVIIDGLCPLPYCLRSAEYIIVAFGISEDYVFTCMSSMRYTFSALFQYLQALSSLMLAVDRFYAVVAPFIYYGRSYPKLVASFIISVIWLLSISVSLILPMISSPMAPGEDDRLCEYWFKTNDNRSIGLKYVVIVGVNIVTLLVYIAVFIHLRCRYRFLGINAPTIQAHGAVGQRSGAMALTFFSIYFSTLVLFISAPLAAIVVNFPTLKTPPGNLSWLINSFILLFYINCTLNGVILAIRTPAIRKQLGVIWPSRPIAYRPPKSQARSAQSTV